MDNYVIVTSAYNEENNISRTIESVIKQSILPIEWIIINDGSTDKTKEIVEEYSHKYNFIKLINKNNNNVEFGAHVAINFKIGLRSLKNDNWNFIAQLDADIEIDRKDFFEYQINQMNMNGQIGITSGITYTMINGIKKLNNKRPSWRTGGATKFYRKECFKDIGGIKPIFAWDGLDVYKAMYRGWETLTFYELEVNHLGVERMLTRHKTLEKMKLIGKSYYQRGYPIEFVIFKSLSYIKISFIHTIWFLIGYIIARRNQIKQYVNKDEKKFIRKFQYKRLLGLMR